jgi:hypothetical protein
MKGDTMTGTRNYNRSVGKGLEAKGIKLVWVVQSIVFPGLGRTDVAPGQELGLALLAEARREVLIKAQEMGVGILPHKHLCNWELPAVVTFVGTSAEEVLEYLVGAGEDVVMETGGSAILNLLITVIREGREKNPGAGVSVLGVLDTDECKWLRGLLNTLEDVARKQITEKGTNNGAQ